MYTQRNGQNVMNTNSRWLWGKEQGASVKINFIKSDPSLPIGDWTLKWRYPSAPIQSSCGLTILFRILNRSFCSFGSTLQVSTSAKFSVFSGDRQSGFSPPYSWTSIDRHLDATSKISGSLLGSWKLTDRMISPIEDWGWNAQERQWNLV